MSNVASPFGLKPAFHPSGVIRQLQSTIVSGHPTDIFQFSPVAILASGALGTVAPGNPVIGSFMGVEWTGVDGRRRVGGFCTAIMLLIGLGIVGCSKRYLDLRL